MKKSVIVKLTMGFRRKMCENALVEEYINTVV